MRNDEPLEGWLYLAKMYAEHGRPPYPKGTSREALERLAQVLTAQPEGKIDYGKLRGGVISVYSPQWFSPSETAEAERLFLPVWERGGPGSSHVEEGLLQSIALALQPASTPFWRQLLDLSRPRDNSTTRRRTMALAALALLAIVKDDAAAYAALAEALTHPHEHVRALGAFYLARSYAIPQRALSAPLEAALVELASRDQAFAPRFQARAALRTLGQAVPQDDPESVYFLKVLLRGAGVTRTLALLPQHSLAQLHYAIQRAFGWDADHLYSFFMNGGRDEKLYEIRCPELDPNGDFSFWSALAPEAQSTPAREVEPLDTTSASIGALGLVPKHQFIYFFDYGDSHVFVVTVLSVEKRSDDSTYPRVTERRGEAPRQYHSWGEDDEG